MSSHGSMRCMKPWHDDPKFWKLTAPFMFDEERWKKTPKQVVGFIKRLRMKKGMEVLDLCCGPGRISLELARKGFNVTGVDHMPFFLREARMRAQREKLRCKFIHGDMRTFRRPNVFDVVLSIYTSFGYFKNNRQNQKVLRNIHDSLKCGGKLLMELMSREGLRRIFTPRDWDERDGMFLLQERCPKRNWRWMENRWIVIVRGCAYASTLTHNLYSAQELTSMLRKAGFRSVRTTRGDKRLVVIAVK